MLTHAVLFRATALPHKIIITSQYFFAQVHKPVSSVCSDSHGGRDHTGTDYIIRSLNLSATLKRIVLLSSSVILLG